MRLTSACTAAAVVMFLGAAQAAPVQLLTNGGFETGNYVGWTRESQVGGNGFLYIDTPGTTTPRSGLFTSANPVGGSFYSVSDQIGPSADILRQSFTVDPNASSVILSFQMFVNSFFPGGPIIGAQGLDYTGTPNQYARVDVLTADGAGADVGAAVLKNFYIGVDPSYPNPYINYSFDITSLVGSGGTYQIRFALVSNQAQLNQGVDNVSILADFNGNSVPEPSSLALVGLAVAGAALTRRRRS